MKILGLKLSQTAVNNIFPVSTETRKSVKEFFLGNIKDYSEMSFFIDIFQGLHSFYRKFQGTFFTKNLLNKPFKFEPKKIEQRKEIREVIILKV